MVSCHLPAGHPGEHEEDGTDVTWTDRRVIRFYVSLNFDGFGGTCVWVYAPGDWDDMTVPERERFLRQEAEQWAAERVEVGGEVYDSIEAAHADARNSHSAYTRWHDEVEKWYD